MLRGLIRPPPLKAGRGLGASIFPVFLLQGEVSKLRRDSRSLPLTLPRSSLGIRLPTHPRVLQLMLLLHPCQTGGVHAWCCRDCL